MSTQPVDAPYRTTLSDACRQAGLDSRGARLLRVHANAIYHLPQENAVARIRNASVLERMRVAVRTAGWLADQGFPALRPLDVAQPIVIGAHLATFWEYLPQTNASPADITPLARLLRTLHRHPLPSFPFPPIRPMGSTAADASASTVLSEGERDWLITRCTELEESFAQLAATLPTVLVHGDAHTNNLLAHPHKGWVLIDWDSVGIGPPQYDFMPIYLRPRRFGHPPSLWSEFRRAYGIDRDEDSSLAQLAEIREVRSLSAFIRGAEHNPAARAELANRLSSLVTRDPSRRWHPL
ncbi:aminoglycoside phosphotransferase family protein [Nonomuraea sp. NPDC049607]|uniref:phosphotransferase enzyme family protein n=1 Tax=Nonomuraea sp. NPDC049607 TaxID=3154732 RepID=UPI00341AED15